jgi:dTDP-4-amino-4,6-dideoxygalactose transaminase
VSSAPRTTATPAIEPFIPFSAPSISPQEVEAVVAVLQSGWLTTGPRVREFEAAMAAATGARFAIAVNSCTAALHLSLLAAGIGPGDEVITTPLTFCACANVIEHVGATPRFADVEPDTLTLDPIAVESALSSRTRAILAVHYAGHPAELDSLHDIARGHRLGVLEDAAHAIPASYKGRLIGSGENPVAFSFYATKNLTTGEGGMLTGSSDLIQRARRLALHGMSRDAWNRYGPAGNWYYEVHEAGFKYNMTDIQAAMGLAQLRKLADFQHRRRQIAAAYTEAFRDIDALETPVERPEVEHAWHLYVLRLRLGALRIDRSRFIQELRARNIGTSVHFIPLHLHPYYREKYQYRPEDFPIALSNYQRMLSLPLHPRLSDRDVEDVIDAVLDVVARFSR